MSRKLRELLSKYILPAGSLLLAVAMMISMGACGGVKNEKLSGTSGDFNLKEHTTGVRALHRLSDEGKLTEVVSSGLVKLIFDMDTFAVCVRDTSHNKLWSSLPAADNDCANVAELHVTVGTDEYSLTTQDNSVEFGKAKMETTEHGVKVTYVLTPDRETADKKSYESGDIAFKLTLDYTLKDGSMYVSAETENLVKASSAKLKSLELLPYFGAYDTAAQGDFIFVPDGSGAVIKTDKQDDDFEKPLEFAVYGSDPSAQGGSTADYSAIVPVYGMKQGDSAFIVLISSGDALATIAADRVRDDNDFFKVGSTFSVTSYGTRGSAKHRRISVADSGYDGSIDMCVRFLNGSNANYTGMAAAAREQLIRNGVLSTKSSGEGEYLPLDLTVIGVAKDKLFSLGKFTFSVNKTFTNFEQAQDMVERMKGKGINGINLRYEGALSGGMDQGDIADADIMRRLGSQKDLTELCEYMQAQNMEIFLDVDLLSAAEKDDFPSSRTAKNIFGDKAEYSYVDGASDFVGKSTYQKNLLRISKTEYNIIKLLSNSKYKLFTGFCVSDAGNLLYSDFRDGNDRQDSAAVISEQLSSLTVGRCLMTDNGNFFMVKDADYISHIPVTCAAPEDEAYSSVPFVQLVLHGIVEYSCSPINLSSDEKTAMLRCIEYGACPAYEWTYKDSGEKEGRSLYYDNYINSAADFYTKASAALNDVRASRMTSHEEVKPGVFCTEYDTGAMIYVNYTSEDAVVSGITVPAVDFIRIN